MSTAASSSQVRALPPTLRLVRDDEELFNPPPSTGRVLEPVEPLVSDRVVTDLAQNVQVGENLAVRFSILASKNPEDTQLERRQRFLYAAALPLMLLIALIVAVQVGVWRVFFWLSWRFGRIHLSKKEFANRYELGPASLSWPFLGSPMGRQLRADVTTASALTPTYSYNRYCREAKGGKLTLGDRAFLFWINQPDGQAVRNRLRMVHQFIGDELERIFKDRGVRYEIKVLSLACGSAEATIRAVQAFNLRYPQARVEVTLVDLNRGSLRQAGELARHCGVKITTICMNLRDYLPTVPDHSFDVIEEVGFRDYRLKASAQWYSAEERRVLRIGGALVTSSIAPSLGAPVVRSVTNWPYLIRRPLTEFKPLVVGPGDLFGLDEAKFYKEPWGIHYLCVAHRIS